MKATITSAMWWIQIWQSGESFKELTPEDVQEFDLVMVTAAHHNIDYEMVQRNARVI